MRRATLLITFAAACRSNAPPRSGDAAVRSAVAVKNIPPGTPVYHDVTTARWDGAEHVIVLGEQAPPPRPDAPVIEQRHQPWGHEQPHWPSVADITPLATTSRVTLVYPDRPTCVGETVATLKWMLWDWRSAFEVRGCAEGASTAFAGDHHQLRFATGKRAVAGDAVRRLVEGDIYRITDYAGGRLVVVTASGGMFGDASAVTFVLAGDTIVLRARSAPLGVFEYGDKLVFLLQHDGEHFVTIDPAAPTPESASQRACWNTYASCAARADADQWRRCGEALDLCGQGRL